MSILSYANQNVWELVAYKPGKPIEETARELGLAPEDIVKLASNENSLGPSPLALEAMQRAIAGVHIYPDGASFSLRSRLAAEYGVSPEQTAVGNGSSELIELLGHAFLKPGTAVVAAEYAFAMYSIVAKLFGAEYISVPNKGGGRIIYRRCCKPLRRRRDWSSSRIPPTRWVRWWGRQKWMRLWRRCRSM